MMHWYRQTERNAYDTAYSTLIAIKMQRDDNIESHVDRANALAAQLDAREYLNMPKTVGRARTKGLLEPFRMVSRLLMFVLQRCCATE